MLTHSANLMTRSSRTLGFFYASASLALTFFMQSSALNADSATLTKPQGLNIELLKEIPAVSKAQPSTDKNNVQLPDQLITKIPLTPMNQIRNPRDEQPSTPSLPEIGVFYDMPGTENVEFTRITSATTKNARRHHYSRRSAIDPFHKYILLHDYLYHLSDLSEYKKVPLAFEFTASQTEEDVFYGFYKSNTFAKWNAKTDEITEIYTAPSGKNNYTIGQYEGEMSWDDKYVALNWDTNGGSQITILNTETGKITGSIHSSEVDGDSLNWVDVSPKGTYVLVGMRNTVYRYNIDLTNKTKLNAKHGGNAHADLMFDVEGNEVIVQEANFNHGQISYTILDTNEFHVMSLVDTTTQTGVSYPNSSSHVSGQARDQQGFVLISLQDTSGMFNMFGAYLKPGQNEVYKYGHTYTHGNSYPKEAKASIDNSGRYIVWSSDWMGGGETYEFLARIKCTDSLSSVCAGSAIMANSDDELLP